MKFKTIATVFATMLMITTVFGTIFATNVKADDSKYIVIQENHDDVIATLPPDWMSAGYAQEFSLDKNTKISEIELYLKILIPPTLSLSVLAGLSTERNLDYNNWVWYEIKDYSNTKIDFITFSVDCGEGNGDYIFAKDTPYYLIIFMYEDSGSGEHVIIKGNKTTNPYENGHVWFIREGYEPYAYTDCDFAFKLWGEELNTPPDTPSKPSGPVSGEAGISYTYSTSTADPDGDNVKYGWDWNGDDVVDEWTDFYTSDTTCSIDHSWSSVGTYDVKVIAKDVNEAQSDDFSSALTVVITEGPVEYILTMCVDGSGTTSPSVGQYSYEAGSAVSIEAFADSGWGFDYWTGDVDDPNSASTCIIMNGDKTATAHFTEDDEPDNNPPNTPSCPSGPTTYSSWDSYTFSTKTTDPDGNGIKYGWDWDGDDVVDEWSSYHGSGITCQMLHGWSEVGKTFYVKVMAEDLNGAQSDWSQSLQVKSEWAFENKYGAPWYNSSAEIEGENPSNPKNIATIDKTTGEGEVCAYSGLNDYNKAWVEVGSKRFEWTRSDSWGLLVFSGGSYVKGKLSNAGTSSSCWAFVKIIVNEFDSDGNHIKSTSADVVDIAEIGSPFYYNFDDESMGFKFHKGYRYEIWAKAKCSAASRDGVATAHIEEIAFKELWLYLNTNEDFCPVSAEIIKPENTLYMGNKEIMPWSHPFIFGDVDIKVLTTSKHFDEDKVEFYINDVLKGVDKTGVYQGNGEELFSWNWNEFVSRPFTKKKIEVIAYDKDGIKASDTIEKVTYWNPLGDQPSMLSVVESVDSNKESDGYMKVFKASLPISSDDVDCFIDLTGDEGLTADISYTYIFDYGDGATETIENIDELSCTVLHTYEKSGKYIVKVDTILNIYLDLNGNGNYDDDECYHLSKTSEITIGKAESNNLFVNLLQKLLDLFPGLEPIIEPIIDQVTKNVDKTTALNPDKSAEGKVESVEPIDITEPVEREETEELIDPIDKTENENNVDEQDIQDQNPQDVNSEQVQDEGQPQQNQDSNQDTEDENNQNQDQTQSQPLDIIYAYTNKDTAEEDEDIQFYSCASGGERSRTYHWDFGDGTTSTQTQRCPMHAYVVEGEYTPVLTVTDEIGDTITQELDTIEIVDNNDSSNSENQDQTQSGSNNHNTNL